MAILRIIFFVIFASSHVYACELTDEYKEVRTQYVQEARKAYAMCTCAVSESEYWYKHVQCLEAGDGKMHVGGCGHMASIPNDRYKSLGIDPSFCEKLKPSTEAMKLAFDEFINEAGIARCK